MSSSELDSLPHAVRTYRDVEAMFPVFDAAIEATQAHNGSGDYDDLIRARLDAAAYTDIDEHCLTLRLRPTQLVLSIESGDILRPRGVVPESLVDQRVVGNRIDMTTTPPFRNAYVLFSTRDPGTLALGEPRVFINVGLDGLRHGLSVRKRGSIKSRDGLVAPRVILSELARQARERRQ